MPEDDFAIQSMPSQQPEKDWLTSALEDAATAARRGDDSHLSELLPIFNMNSKDASAFVRTCDRAMKSHASDFAEGRDKEAALSAFEAAMATLLEIRPAYPAEHANIDEVLRRHGYSKLET